MTKVTAKGKFNTSFGMAFLVENPPALRVGESISVDGDVYQIKRIVLPSRPTDADIVAIYV